MPTVPVSLRLDSDVFNRLEACAEFDQRTVANLMKKMINDALPVVESEIADRKARLSPVKPVFAVPGRSQLPKGKRGIDRKSQN